MSTYYIYIPTKNGKMKIDCSQIFYVESNIQFSTITFADGERLDLILTMNEIEDLLSNQGFFRFNFKYLVNLRYVEVLFPSNASKVVLENGKEIFVNPNKKDELFESLMQVYNLNVLV